MTDPSEVGLELARLKATTGMTYAQLADTIGASSGEYVRKVIAGVKPGRNLRAAVGQLVERGRVTTPPPRRRTAAGGLARVRAAGPERSTIPQERDLRAYRGRFSTTTQLVAGGRGRRVTVTSPRSEGIGRERARAALADTLRAAERDGRSVSFLMEYADGTRARIGAKSGYNTRMIMRRLRSGEDVFEWLGEQGLAGQYSRAAPIGPLVEVTVIVDEPGTLPKAKPRRARPKQPRQRRQRRTA